MEVNKIYNMDCAKGLDIIEDKSVQCIITSPPYWGLRDYGEEKQLGTESTPDEYIDNLCDIFSKCKKVLKDDGVLYVNIADSYFRNGGKSKGTNPKATVGNTKKGISGDYDAPICPECKQVVDVTEHYCSTCGQALDWRDLE